MTKKKEKASLKNKPKVNSELEGFEFRVNSFGEISSSLDMDKINAFLDKHVDDKKLKDKAEED